MGRGGGDGKAEMISVGEAIRAVLADVEVGPAERVSLDLALGRTLAQDVAVGADVPAFANSQMDGFAVRSADLRDAGAARPIALRVLGTIAAGARELPTVAPGTALRIMTGAPIPPGADAVVPIEEAFVDGDRVRTEVAPAAGRFVRPAGEDLRAGEIALRRSRVLRAADVGLLASMGRAEVTVHVRPRVGILSTGDELIALGEALKPGQIYNSNAYALAAAVREVGAEPMTLDVVRDDRDSLRTAFRAASGCDFILSTGGVSVGDFDFVKDIMEEVGLERRFWRVAQKPGKPITFARGAGSVFFGLPGNPVSALVCFALYVGPALRHALGQREIHASVARVRMGSEVRTARNLTELIRCTLRDHGHEVIAEPTGTQSSGALRSMALADVLVISPPGQATLAAGSLAVALRIRPGDPLAAAHPFDA